MPAWNHFLPFTSTVNYSHILHPRENWGKHFLWFENASWWFISQLVSWHLLPTLKAIFEWRPPEDLWSLTASTTKWVGEWKRKKAIPRFDRFLIRDSSFGVEVKITTRHHPSRHSPRHLLAIYRRWAVVSWRWNLCIILFRGMYLSGVYMSC